MISYTKRIVSLFVALFAAGGIASVTGWAEIVTDGSVGRAMALTGPDFLIPSDIGKQVGGNLFHSFERFDIHSTEKAVFTGPDDVARVISRVTGGNASVIDGGLSCDMPNADFYFLNPAGILIGPNAAVDVGGSLFLSSADVIRLVDGGAFSADEPEKSTLTSAPPAAFGFLEGAPGNVAVQGRLTVPEERSISLTGGRIAFSGAQLETLNGQIHIAAVSSPGETSIDGQTLTAFDRMGTVELSHGSTLTAYGNTTAAITIQGEQLVIDNSGVESVCTGSSAIGDITLDLSDALEIKDGGDVGTIYYGTESGGDIRLTAESVSLSEGASVFTQTLGTGSAGNISVTAEKISIHGKTDPDAFASRFISLSDAAAGGTGDILISTGSLLMDASARIINHHLGNGYRGTTSVLADVILMDAGSDIMAGNVTMETGELEISQGAYVWSRPSAFGAAALRVDASRSVLITGEGEDIDPWRNKTDPMYTGLFTDTFVTIDSAAGNIFITAPLIEITDSGQISARTFCDYRAGDIFIDTGKLHLKTGGQVGADSFGSSIFEGPAGNVTVHASEHIEIYGKNGELYAGIYSTTRSDAGAGEIYIHAPAVTLGDSGRIMVSTGVFGKGDAGKIFLRTENIDILPGGGILARSWGYGDQGRIEITAKDGITIQKGGFITSAGRSDGAAGDIVLETAALHMSGGLIYAYTLGNRKGGDIIIRAHDILLEQNSDINASSTDFGDAGAIFIQADTATLSDSEISTETVASDGGDIHFDIDTLLDLNDARVTTSVAGGLGNGGNIGIEKPIFVIMQSTEIIANAFEGRGGNIFMDLAQLVRDPGSRIDASSQKGISGQIDISSPDTDISGSIAALPAAFLDAAAFLKNPCSEKIMGQNTSSLLSTGFFSRQDDPDDFFVDSFSLKRNGLP